MNWASVPLHREAAAPIPLSSVNPNAHTPETAAGQAQVRGRALRSGIICAAASPKPIIKAESSVTDR